MATFDPNMSIGFGMSTMMFGKTGGGANLSQTMMIGQKSQFGDGPGRGTQGMQSFNFFSLNQRKLFKSRHSVISTLPKGKALYSDIDVGKILGEYPIEYKLSNLQYKHKQMCKKWKLEYDSNRAKNMPSLICRNCNKSFYADMASLHNSSCKNLKLKLSS